MLILFGRHAVEQRGRGGKIGAQHPGVRAVDAGVVLFGRDGESDDFLIAQVVEAFALGQKAHGVHTLELF